MIGYLKDNKDFFKGRAFEYNLKKAVSFSGGTEQHYNLFVALLQHSVFNKSTGRPLHDSRAGQFLLHLFPIKMQVLLSIVLYQYESNLIKEFDIYSLDETALLLPSQQIQYNSIITKNTIAQGFLLSIDDVATQNSSINDQILEQLKRIFNITFTLNDLNGTLVNNVDLLLTKFRVATISKAQYSNIVKTNNKLDAAIITAKALNYKPQSIQYLTEAVSIWRQNSST